MNLQEELRASTLFGRLVHVPICPSTQVLSMDDPAPGSAAYWADHQTAGRGRQGRTWIDAPELDVAVTFRIAGLSIVNPTHLAAAVPVAVVRALAASVPDVRVRWPNDILLGGRKLCGVLIDTSGRPPHTYHVGVGINVNRATFPPEIMEHGTSLALATGREFDRAAIVLELARAVSAIVDQLVGGRDLGVLAAEFRDRLGLQDRRVQARTGSRVVEGFLRDVDLDRVDIDGTVIPLAHVQQLRPF